MLVLTRKESQSIVIDGRITVTVLAADGGRVRLGGSAPRGVPVDREEVCRRAQEPARSGTVRSRYAEGAAI